MKYKNKIVAIIVFLFVVFLSWALCLYFYAPELAVQLKAENLRNLNDELRSFTLTNRFTQAFYNIDSIVVKSETFSGDDGIMYTIDDDLCGWWICENIYNDGNLYSLFIYPTSVLVESLSNDSLHIQMVQKLLTDSYESVMQNAVQLNTSYWDQTDSLCGLSNEFYHVEKDSTDTVICEPESIELAYEEGSVYCSRSQRYYFLCVKDNPGDLLSAATNIIQKKILFYTLCVVILIIILLFVVNYYHKVYVEKLYSKINGIALNRFITNEYEYTNTKIEANDLLKSITKRSREGSVGFKKNILSNKKRIDEFRNNDDLYGKVVSLQRLYTKGFNFLYKSCVDSMQIHELEDIIKESNVEIIKQKDEELNILDNYTCFILNDKKRSAFIDDFFKRTPTTIEDKTFCLEHLDKLDIFISKRVAAIYNVLRCKYERGLEYYEKYNRGEEYEIINHIDEIKIKDTLLKNWLLKHPTKATWQDIQTVPTPKPYHSNNSFGEVNLTGCCSDILYVDYFVENLQPNESYPIIRFPKLGTVVYPYRINSQRKYRRGFLELYFEQFMKKYIETDRVKIYHNITLLFDEGRKPYEPDIAIVVDRSCVRLDIEIDEPYSGLDRKPTHYIGNDNYRDKLFVEHGWGVIRFAEQQIKEQPIECVGLVCRQLNRLEVPLNKQDFMMEIAGPLQILRWTFEECKEMAENSAREKYLGIDAFGYSPDGTINDSDIQMSNVEKKIASLCQTGKDVFADLKNSYIVWRESKVVFNSVEHLYYVDSVQYQSVSNLISHIFPKFNSEYWAGRKTTSIDDKKRLLEEWDCRGNRSKEVGTFLHTQIGRFFRGERYDLNYTFNYRGNYYSVIGENIAIDREMQQLTDFCHCHNPRPFKIGWHIYDEYYKIAGTIDLLTKDKFGNYILYDWKRTKKLGNENKGEIVGDAEIIELSDFECSFIVEKDNGRYYIELASKLIPDSRFYQYALQQNIYKRILQDRYNIRIHASYLVVLHSDYSTYHCIEVPSMDEVCTEVFENINKYR